MKNLKVSVVVCTYNGVGRIRDLLDSLKKQTYRNMEVVVVDDGSTDGTPDIVKEYPYRLVRHKVNRGLAYSRNTGIKSAKGDIIVFTDDDCVADKNWIRNIAACYQENPEINAIGGKVKPYSLDTVFEKYAYLAKHPVYGQSAEYGGEKVKTYIKNMFNLKQKTLRDGQRLKELMGLNSSFKKDLVLKVGMHEPGLRRGVDWDLNEKLRKTDFNAVYCDSAVIYHKHRTGLKAFVKHMFAYGKAFPKICRIHPDVKFLPRPLPLLFLLLFPAGFTLNIWYLPLLVILFYYLKGLPYTIFKLKSIELSLAIPFIDFLREFVYLMGSFWGFIK